MEELEISEVLQNEVSPKVDCKENAKQEEILKAEVTVNTVIPVEAKPVENSKPIESVSEITSPESKGKLTLSVSDFESLSVEELMGLACQTFECLKVKMAKKTLPDEDKEDPEEDACKKKPKEMAKEFINEMEKKAKENEKLSKDITQLTAKIQELENKGVKKAVETLEDTTKDATTPQPETPVKGKMVFRKDGSVYQWD